MSWRRPVPRARRRAVRSPWPIPADARAVLASIPARFIDDGASNAPDGILGYDFRWAARIHDHRYCSRAHPPHTMGPAHRLAADRELRRNIAATVPPAWWLIPWAYFAAVRRYGGPGRAYDTCGPFMPLGASDEQRARGECRHGMPCPPRWPVGDR